MSEYYRYLKYLKYINGVPQDEYKQGDLIGVVEADSLSDCEQGVEYRWVEVPNEYYCDGYVKYAKERKQAYRNGVWENTSEYRKGLVLDLWSTDCGVEWQYRWESTGKTACNGYQLTTQQVHLVSKDMGNTWLNVEPVEYREMVTDEFSELCLDSVEPFTFIPNNLVKVDYIYMRPFDKDSSSVIYYVDWGEGRKRYWVSADIRLCKSSMGHCVLITDEIPLTDHEIKIWGPIAGIGKIIQNGSCYYFDNKYFKGGSVYEDGKQTDITEIVSWGEYNDFHYVCLDHYYGTKIAKLKDNSSIDLFVIAYAPYLKSLSITEFGSCAIQNCVFETLPEITVRHSAYTYSYSSSEFYYAFTIKGCDNLTNISIRGTDNDLNIDCLNIEEVKLNCSGDYISGLINIKSPKLKTVSGSITSTTYDYSGSVKMFIDTNDSSTLVNVDNLSIVLDDILLYVYGNIKALPNILVADKLNCYLPNIETLNLDNIIMSSNSTGNHLYVINVRNNKKLTTITGTLKNNKVGSTELIFHADGCTNLKQISPILRDWTDYLPASYDDKHTSDPNYYITDISFKGCTSLQSIPNDFFGDNIKYYNDKTYVPYEMFKECTSLTNYPVKGGVPIWEWPLFYKDRITNALTFDFCPKIASEVPVQWGGIKFEGEYMEVETTLDSSNFRYCLAEFSANESNLQAIINWGDNKIEWFDIGDYGGYDSHNYVSDYWTTPTGDLRDHTYLNPGTYKIKIYLFYNNYNIRVEFIPNAPTNYNKIGNASIRLIDLNNIGLINIIGTLKTMSEIELKRKVYNPEDIVISNNLPVSNIDLYLTQIPNNWILDGLLNNYLQKLTIKTLQLLYTNIDLSQFIKNCPNITLCKFDFGNEQVNINLSLITINNPELLKFDVYGDNTIINLYQAFKGSKINSCDIKGIITDATEAFYGCNSLLTGLYLISRCQKAVRTYANSKIKGKYDSSTGEYIYPLGNVTTPDMTECFMNTPIKKVSINSIAEGVNLTRCFSDCQQLEEIPKVGDKYLWEIPGITGTECFKGCVKLDMSIIPDGWK